MEIRNRAVLKVTWFNGNKSEYIYDKNIKTFIREDNKAFFYKTDFSTVEDLKDFIEHSYENVGIPKSTIQSYELIND